MTNANLSKGQAVIDLGDFGKLILPVEVDGGHWFYYWDKNGDGLANAADKSTYTYLSSIFNKSVTGTINPSSSATDIYRYALLNGEKVALPTMGVASFTVNGPKAQQTSISGATVNKLSIRRVS